MDAEHCQLRFYPIETRDFEGPRREKRWRGSLYCSSWQGRDGWKEGCRPSGWLFCVVYVTSSFLSCEGFREPGSREGSFVRNLSQ